VVDGPSSLVRTPQEILGRRRCGWRSRQRSHAGRSGVRSCGRRHAL